MEQILNALKAKLKEQDKATDRYDYRCGLHDAIKIVETFTKNNKLKVFELTWKSQDEKEWIAAHTNIEAIKTYLSITHTDITDLDDEDEIVEIPKEEWSKITIRNSEYNKTDPGVFETKTVEEYMKDCKSPDLIAGTMY